MQKHRPGDMYMPEQQESLLVFPTEFPIKVIGKRRDELAQTLLEVVLRHAPDFKAETIEMRSSRAGRYLSLTFTINATSREQLDALYRELSGHPLVAWAI